ncbi:MAG: alginate export family protein [Leptospiraceae bacterium]|nr:alginate export family protein [Leptospiraceae bacterium]
MLNKIILISLSFFLLLPFTGLISQETKEVKKTSKETNENPTKSVSETSQTLPSSEAKEAEPEVTKKSTETISPVETKDTTPTSSAKEAVNIVLPEDYKSDQKGNMNIDHLRSIFVTPEQMGALRKSRMFWIDDKLKIGFHIRPRFESRQNADFNRNTDDYSSFTGQNTQLWFILDPSPYFSAKITIQDARLWGGNQNPTTGGDSRYALSNNSGREITPATTTTPTVQRTSTDIREAYILLKKNEKLPFDIQIGRQIFAYGDLKLLGPLNWLNNGFSFDGIRFKHESKYFSSHVFGSTLAEQHDAPGGLLTTNSRRRGSIDDAYFTGIYNTIKPWEHFWIDLYAFGLHKKWIPATTPAYPLPNAQITTEDRQKQRDNMLTTGFRITNRTNNNTLPKGKFWDWTIESAFQTGKNGEIINASWDYAQVTYDTKRVYKERVRYDSKFISAESGFLVLPSLRLGLGYTYASGDSNRNDGVSSTWNPLFPQIAGTLPYWNVMNGQSTMVGFQNVKSYSIRANYKTEKYGTFILAAYDILKAKSQDAWYNAAGGSVTNGSSENFGNERFKYNANAHLGKRLFYQYDITWVYNYGEHVSIWSGFSLIQAQDAVRNIRQVGEASRYNFEPTSRYFYFMVSAVL